MNAIEEQYADLETHHIEGFAHHGGHRIKVPLISHVEGNLWQGGCFQGVRLPDDFDFVVSLYPWEQYSLGPTTARLEYKLYDSADIPDERQLYDVARMVNAFSKEGKTLVHCQAGLNRSGLIGSLALVLQGWSPKGAIKRLREKRSPVVLCNTTFEQWLLDQGDDNA